MRVARVASWVAVLVTAVFTGVVVLLDALSSRSSEPLWVSYVFPLAIVMSTGVGLVLATRRPENAIGWLLLANGLVLSLSGLATNYATYGILENPGSLPAADWAVLFDQQWPVLFAAFTAIAFVFPDGRLLSPRWRPVAIAAGASFAAMTVLLLLDKRTFDAPFAAVSSPIPVLPKGVFLPLFSISAVGMLGSLFAAALAVLTRLRRSSGLERSQIKLLAYAAALIPAAVVAGWVEGFATDGSSDVATLIGFATVLLAIPLAIGVAVMRYRLYEVDRLINRTLVYVVLTAMLAATYAAVSLSLGVALGASSTLPTAAATLAVAVVFGTLRARVQRLVDKRFSRDRYEGLRCIERFLGELRAGRATPEATGEVLSEALDDPTLELLFWIPDGELLVDARGIVTEVAPDSGRVLTPVRRGSLRLGVVVHDAALSERPDLLESMIDAAGLAIEIARLRAEVARRLAEVEQSRARIVTAGYEERRRLERDLHDGAQQRLVSIGLALRNIQGRLPANDAGARDSLDLAVDGLGGAIEELRELARGVRPACLDDGLVPALYELVARSPLRTEVQATAERFDEGIEAAAYFVASEALTNSAKYAQASRVMVTAERRNGTLVLSVSDDGIGGAEASEGSGLTGITDRVAALGGSVRVLSPPGQGTAITAELPCGS